MGFSLMILKRCKYSTVIVGGGLAGSIMAAVMKQSGFEPTVIERKNSIQDNRTTAISHAAAAFLKLIGVWQDVPQSPIESIEITDYNASSKCIFEAKDVGIEAFGHIVENSWLRQRALDVASVSPINDEVVSMENTEKPSVRLASGKIITTDIIIAADGRNSPIRKMLGIAAPVSSYEQAALVGVISHIKPHKQRAFERFLPGGPLALLPLQQQKSAMVWSERAAVANEMQQLSKKDFNDILQQRFGNALGELSLDNDLSCYPLSVVHAQQYAVDSTFLVGDAAHGIHPIAGQGFNLSLRDMEYLQEQLKQFTRLGLPINTSIVANNYNVRRRLDNTAMVAGTHILNNLFINDKMIVQQLRKLGLFGVDKLPPVKKFFMRYASGLVHA